MYLCTLIYLIYVFMYFNLFNLCTLIYFLCNGNGDLLTSSGYNFVIVALILMSVLCLIFLTF